MKKYKRLPVTVLLLGLSLSSCHDQLLELTPPSELTEVDFYQTADDINRAVLGIYHNLKSRKPDDYAVLGFPADNLYRSSYTAPAGANELDNLAITSENPLFARFWESAYNGIFRANAVLVNIDNPDDYEAGQKEQLSGEASFARALLYFDLVRMFGGVPEVTSLLSVEEASGTPRAGEDEIYSLIIEDLKHAVDNLPPKEEMDKGRATEGAAAALLAKVYVYREDWENALIYLNRVEELNYGLAATFASLWKTENEDNAEVIFSLKYIDATDGHTLSTRFLPYVGVTGVASRGEETGFPTWDLNKSYETGDTRKAATITEFWRSPTTPGEPEIWYPYVSKYAVPHTAGASGLDLPVLRYADVVLLKAEALYRLNQPAQALSELNKIRARAFGDDLHNYTLADIATEQAFLDKLLLERRLEFAFENERWFDLVRTGRFLTELAEVETHYNYDTQTPTRVKFTVKPHYRYFPVPQTQIEMYPPGVLTQNEGY